jgi:hypothetical protein
LDGKVPSVREKFMMVVIGWSRTSRQDFRRKVGMMSSEHVPLEDRSMAARTSSAEAGENSGRSGGGTGGTD